MSFKLPSNRPTFNAQFFLVELQNGTISTTLHITDHT